MNDLEYLISYLAEKQNINCRIPDSEKERFSLYRTLCQGKDAQHIKDESFLEVQDRYLQAVNKSKGTVSVSEMKPVRDNIYIWNGDITRLKVDAIVNASSEDFLGVFTPCSSCIENAFNIYSGCRLKNACDKLLPQVHDDVGCGSVAITLAYNLPSKYIIHTASPFTSDGITSFKKDMVSLAYRKCLHLAWLNGVKSIAFCLVLFNLPEEMKVSAAKTAVSSVKEWIAENPYYQMDIVFDVFTEADKMILENVL